VDDRPGIAHVTDIPPAGAAKATGESKKPVVDFIRAMWKTEPQGAGSAANRADQ